MGRSILVAVPAEDADGHSYLKVEDELPTGTEVKVLLPDDPDGNRVWLHLKVASCDSGRDTSKTTKTEVNTPGSLFDRTEPVFAPAQVR